MWYSASNGEVAIVLAFSSQKASTLAITISLHGKNSVRRKGEGEKENHIKELHVLLHELVILRDKHTLSYEKCNYNFF